MLGGAIGDAIVVGGYDDTDVGRIVTLSFIGACSTLVVQMGATRQGSAGTAEAPRSKAFMTVEPATLRVKTAGTGIRRHQPATLGESLPHRQSRWSVVGSIGRKR